ncbi:MAG: hypothetical protein ABJN36_18170 [Cyclobacteriaceae bacterium]
MNCGKLCLFALALVVSVKAFTQATSSPYSSNGIGEIAYQGLQHNFAMGETGIGTPSPWHINLENPALLTFNSLSSFQVGLQGESRKFRTQTASNSESSVGLRYMALSLPVVSRSRWITSFALLPLSSVSYHTVSFRPIDDELQEQTDYYGDGGLSQLIWANGFRISNSLSVGFKAAYVFGSIDSESNIKMVDSTGLISSQDYLIAYRESTSYSDIQFSVGASYHAKLSESKFLNFGAVYNISGELEGKKDTYFERQTIFGSTIQSQEISSGEKSTFEFPVSFGFGVSFENVGKYKIGVDVRNQFWDKSTPIESGEVYRNTTSVSVGGEFIPDYQSVNNYFSRVKYRAGISYRQSPYILNDTEINDFGINFGTSMPMIGASSLDLGFKFGVRGTTKNNLIRENYFQFVLGATINDRWFIKRRYD